MADTALAAAFVAAGYDTPWDRLHALATEAWARWPGTDAGGARRDFVSIQLQGEMSWALLMAFQPPLRVQAIGWLLNRVAEEIKDQRPERNTAPRAVTGGGQVRIETQINHAPATPRNAGQPAGDRQSSCESQLRSAVTNSSRDDARPQAERRSELASLDALPSTPAPTAPNLTALADKQSAAMEARARVEVRLSRLDTVKIDGRPIGDCTVAEVRAWAERRSADQRIAARDVRFALSLIGANLGSNEVVRKWVRPEEADTIYDRAETEHAA